MLENRSKVLRVLTTDLCIPTMALLVIQLHYEEDFYENTVLTVRFRLNV